MKLNSFLKNIDLNNNADVDSSFVWLESLFLENLNQSDVARELASISIEELSIIQYNFRRILQINYRKPHPTNYWMQLTPQNLGSNLLVWALATFHFNGYVREQALKNLLGIKTNIALPFLLLRILDWVSPISEFAALELMKRLNNNNSDSIFQHVSFWHKIKYSQRISSELFDTVENFIKTDSVIQKKLQENFQSSPKDFRRAFFPYIVEGTKFENLEFIFDCFKDRDLKIKFFALQQFKKWILTNELARKFHESMITNTFMPIRREALLIAINWKLQKPEPVLKRALLDPHASIRELAQFKLREMDLKLVALETYRSTICDKEPLTKELQTAILGLGETGTSEDTVLIAPFLKHSSTRIVSASMSSLSKLNDGIELQRCIYDLLQSPSNKISREASKILSKKHSWLDLDKLFAIFEENSKIYIKKHIIYISDDLGKWERMHFLLKSLESNNEMLTELALDKLTQLVYAYNRVQTKPSAALSPLLKKLLLTHKEILSNKETDFGLAQSNLFEALESILKSIN